MILHIGWTVVFGNVKGTIHRIIIVKDLKRKKCVGFQIIFLDSQGDLMFRNDILKQQVSVKAASFKLLPFDQHERKVEC